VDQMAPRASITVSIGLLQVKQRARCAFCISPLNKLFDPCTISVQVLRFFLPRTQQQLETRVKASPLLIPHFLTTTQDLLQPDSPPDTCSRSNATAKSLRN